MNTSLLVAGMSSLISAPRSYTWPVFTSVAARTIPSGVIRPRALLLSAISYSFPGVGPRAPRWEHPHPHRLQLIHQRGIAEAVEAALWPPNAPKAGLKDGILGHTDPI